jgi:hypothetical protein
MGQGKDGMTDRELLELAAKAAGLRIDVEATNETGRGVYLDDESMTLWNPLTDDGDALRLAVKLRLEVAPCDSCAIVSDGEPPAVYVREDGKDTYTATRRAIVRAAAEIGETA